MTPKEKAKELFYKFNTITSNEFKSDTVTSAKAAKQCVIMSVDEIIKNFDGMHKPEYAAFDVLGEQKYTLTHEQEYPTHKNGYEMQDYWNEVKTELKKL